MYTVAVHMNKVQLFSSHLQLMPFYLLLEITTQICTQITVTYKEVSVYLPVDY